ncbi:MAG: hypothetical protein U0940_04135, partial [Nitrospirota bacterium]|nr:hypothetical protein [Nitrospirota bacterium]
MYSITFRVLRFLLVAVAAASIAADSQEAFAVDAAREEARSVVKEYPLPTPYSQPYGIAVDAQGVVWFSGQLANKIGRLDPSSGAIKEYEIPSAKGATTDNKWVYSPSERTPPSSPSGSSAGSPLNMAVDSQGVLWFTEQLGNKIGMFDPATESFKEYAIPSANS